MKFAYILSLFCSIFLLTGCPYESHTPITAAYHAVDSALIGQWFVADFPRQKDTIYYDIVAFNQQEYFIEARQYSDTLNSHNYYRGFISAIAGHKILNLQDFMDDKSYLFLNYKPIGDQMQMLCLNDAYFGDSPLDSSSIQTILLENKDEADLFEKESSIILQPLQK